MAYSIGQSSRYEGENQWRWSVWLEGSDADLDAVELVTYHLHPTFEEPVQVRKERATAFRLDATGWGTFRIEVELKLKSGTTQRLSHMLEFEGGAPTKRGGPSPPVVFLSYASEDQRHVGALRKELEAKGLTVRDGHNIEPGAPWHESLKEAMSSSDGVVGVMTGEFPSEWVVAELDLAGKMDKPVYPIVVGPSTEDLTFATGMAESQVERVPDFEKLAGLATKIWDSLQQRKKG